MNYPDVTNNFQQEHVKLLCDSYEHLLSRDLMENCQNDVEIARQLFHAPFALVSHNAESNPIFNYANLKALALFEFSWEDFTQTPSKLSAEPVNQAEREKLLAQVTELGYIKNYAGIRISKTGKRFMIKNALVWNLTNNGIYQGQAACFAEWAYI